MDWFDFILTQALFVIDQIIKGPTTKKKYKAKLLRVARLILSAYPNEDV